MRLSLLLLTIFIYSCNSIVEKNNHIVTDSVAKINEMNNNCDCSNHDFSFQDLLRCFDNQNCKIPISFVKFFPFDTIRISGSCEILDTITSRLVLKTESKHMYGDIYILYLSAETAFGAYFAVITYDKMQIPVNMIFDCKKCGDYQSSTHVSSETNILFLTDSTFEYNKKTQTSFRMDHHDPYLPIQEKIINNKSVYKINNKGNILIIDSLSRYSEKDSTDLSVLNKYKKEELRIARNAIYAKYNYKFQSKQLTQFFQEHVMGYEPLYDNVDEKLNNLDKKTLKYISDLERNK